MRRHERVRQSLSKHTADPESPAGTLAGLMQDVRYAMRLLRRQPGFTALAIVTTALGVGATTTLGSVAYGVLEEIDRPAVRRRTSEDIIRHRPAPRATHRSLP